MIDECRKYGIEPLITISHYEVPFGLTKKCNAWASRETIEYFLRYCRAIFTRYKGKVKYWLTLCPPARPQARPRAARATSWAGFPTSI